MRHFLFSVSLAIVGASQAAFAGPMQQVELAPIDHMNASLVVRGANGVEVSYTPAQLEEFTTYSLTTATPWREEPAVFEGVLLGDILVENGFDRDVAISVTAENDYSTVLSAELLAAVDILVATRVNGKPHNRRERGPIQFVIEQNVFQTSDLTAESNFVWMAARIEPQD